MDTVHRVTAILEFLFNEANKVCIRDIAKHTEIPKSSVQRILSSLEDAGWVSRCGKSSSYSIGLRVLTLSNSWRLRLELTKRSQEVMSELCRNTHQTVLLLVLEGSRGICLNKVEPERTIKLVADVGKSFPLHAAACGKVLLAYAHTDLQNMVFNSELKAYTDSTITDPKKLENEIRSIHENRCAISVEELTPGAAEIAVPILCDGELLAALSIAGPQFEVEKKFSELKQMLDKAASQMLN